MLSYISVKGENMQKISDLNVVKNLLVEMYDNGIAENDTVRKMDILDYYAISDLDIRKLNIALRENGIPKSKHESSVINQLALKYGGIILSKEDFLKRILGEKQTVSGIEITDDIKFETVNYFAENNIPFTYINYQYYIKRLVTSILQEESRGR